MRFRSVAVTLSSLSPRRALLMCAVLGTTLGAGGGTALALGSWNHTYALWNHGYDGDHIYMSSTDGAGRTASVSSLYNNICSGGQFRGATNTYLASHVHIDAPNGICTNPAAGLYGSSQTGLSWHQHP